MRGGRSSTRVLCGCPSLLIFRYPQPADMVGRTIGQLALSGSFPFGDQFVGVGRVPRKVLEHIILRICDGELIRDKNVVGKMLSNGRGIDNLADALGSKRGR